MKIILFIFTIFLCSCNSEDATTPPAQSSGSPSPVKKVSQLNTGTKSLFKKVERLPVNIESTFSRLPSKEEGFYKFSFPRTDLSVSLDGVKIEPGAGLASWFAFRPIDTVNAMTMLMGELVLLESEVKPVLQKLDQRGIDVSAIHNLLLNEKPKLVLLHINAMGEPHDLCEKMKEVLQQTATPLKNVPADTTSHADWGNTEKNFGITGKREGNLLKFSVPRNEKIREEGIELPETFGINSEVCFQKVGNKTAVSGELALLSTEISTSEKILSRAGIVVTAIHSHMLFDEPHMFFLHFWVLDEPEKVALVLHDLLGSSNHRL